MPTSQDDHHMITTATYKPAEQRHRCDVTVSKVRQTWRWIPSKGHQIQTHMAFNSKWGNNKNIENSFREPLRLFEALNISLSPKVSQERRQIGAKDRSSTTTFNFSIVSSNSFSREVDMAKEIWSIVWSKSSRTTRITPNHPQHWSMLLCHYYWNSLHPMNASMLRTKTWRAQL